MTNYLDLTPKSKVFNENLPPIPELIVSCNNAAMTSNQLHGYTCIEKTADTQSDPVVYFSHLRFGFPFFTRALYRFVLEYSTEFSVLKSEKK